MVHSKFGTEMELKSRQVKISQGPLFRGTAHPPDLSLIQIPEVHLGGGLASAVVCPADAVGDQFHDGGVHSVNSDFETTQETLAFFPLAKAGWMF